MSCLGETGKRGETLELHRMIERRPNTLWRVSCAAAVLGRSRPYTLCFRNGQTSAPVRSVDLGMIRSLLKYPNPSTLFVPLSTLTLPLFARSNDLPSIYKPSCGRNSDFQPLIEPGIRSWACCILYVRVLAIASTNRVASARLNSSTITSARFRASIIASARIITSTISRTSLGFLGF